jgi:hypothetical protein
MMFGPAIDVALGLALIWLVVGLVATAAQELVAGLLAWRAEMLSRKLAQIIRDPALQWEIEEHPLIAAFRGVDGRPPSYIPPACFAAAVLSIATAGRMHDSPHAAFDTIRGWARDDGSPLAQVVLALAPDADGDPERLGAALAQWYADAMDRLAGAYKRRAGLWAFGFAAMTAAALNIDTMRLISALAQDSVQGAGRAAASLPIGWGDGAAVGLDALPLAVLGWLLTGLAASLFSSLWFDVLGRLVNLRHAGPRPAWPQRPAVSATTLAKLPNLTQVRPTGSD